MSDRGIISNHHDSLVITGEGSTKEKGLSEIDELFEVKKNKKRQKQTEEVKKQKRTRNHRQCEPQTSKVGDINNIKSRKDPNRSKSSSLEWIDDGLGGVYNSEGFTGRVEDGVKVFKAHVLRKANSGNSPDCPFDCDCCFI